MRLRLAWLGWIGCALLASAACSDETGGGGSPRAPAGSTDGPADAGRAESGSPPADAAPPASDGAAADAGDPCASRLVCDSFEEDAVGKAPAAPWKAETANGGTVAVSDARAFSGKNSVVVTTKPTQYQRAVLALAGGALFTAPSTAKDVLYGRMMVWLETPAADGVHWTMLAGQGDVKGHAGVRASVRYGGQHMGKLMANYDTSNASTDCWQHSATVMPIGKWTCFAWKLAGPTNDMQLSMDGVEIGDLHVGTKGQGCIGHDFSDAWLAPTFDRAEIGWESYQTDVGHTMYIDDVVLDDAPVACP
jgi:hypothetical protein